MKIYRFDHKVYAHFTKLGANSMMAGIIMTDQPAYIGFKSLKAREKLGYRRAFIPHILFIVSGEGEVWGENKTFRRARTGNAVLWEKGEWNETVTHIGLSAILIASEGLNSSFLADEIGSEYISSNIH